MLEEEAGVMRNAMTTRAPGGAKNDEKYWKYWKNTEQLWNYWIILKNIKKYWKILKILKNAGKMKNTEKYW